MQVAVREAKAKLSRLGDIAHNGETVVVCKNGQPWFDLVPHRKPRRRTAPLDGVSSVVSEAAAIEPVNSEELPGWS